MHFFTFLFNFCFQLLTSFNLSHLNHQSALLSHSPPQSTSQVLFSMTARAALFQPYSAGALLYLVLLSSLHFFPSLSILV